MAVDTVTLKEKPKKDKYII